MSFAPPAQLNNGGIESRRLATTQEGIPLPWFAGIALLKANWITRANNRRTRDKGRKKGEHWYCDITAAFGYGPADGLVTMLYNGKYVGYGIQGCRTPIFRSDHSNYFTIPLGDLGLNTEDHWGGSTGRVHWGLDPQPVNPQDPAASYPLLFGNDTSNPRYWRVILIEWSQLFLGVNNPQRMPNIEVVWARSPRIPGGWTMDTTIPTDGNGNYIRGVNPVAALLEGLTDTHTGFARSPDTLDQSTWEGVASNLSEDKWRINPVIDSQMTEAAFIDEFLKYFDGYTYYRNGKLALGRHPDTVTVLVPEDYTELTDNDFTRSPNLRTSRPDETLNEIQVKWTDPFDAQYKEVTKVFDAPINREARGEPVRENIDLTWKQTEADVDSFATKYLGHAAARRQSGKVWIRANRAKNPDGSDFNVGDVVFLDQSVPQLDHAYRITGISRPEIGEIQLELMTERGQYPLAYVAPADLEPDPTLPEVAPLSGAHFL